MSFLVIGWRSSRVIGREILSRHWTKVISCYRMGITSRHRISISHRWISTSHHRVDPTPRHRITPTSHHRMTSTPTHPHRRNIRSRRQFRSLHHLIHTRLLNLLFPPSSSSSSGLVAGTAVFPPSASRASYITQTAHPTTFSHISSHLAQSRHREVSRSDDVAIDAEVALDGGNESLQLPVPLQQLPHRILHLSHLLAQRVSVDDETPFADRFGFDPSVDFPRGEEPFINTRGIPSISPRDTSFRTNASISAVTAISLSLRKYPRIRPFRRRRVCVVAVPKRRFGWQFSLP